MRLRCSVKVQTQNGTGCTRSSASTLALVKGIKDSLDAHLIHFSTSNKFGKRYRIKGNITKVFTKFTGEGKSTISFKDPQVDMFIQTDPVQLKVFLATLLSVFNGADDQCWSGQLSSMAVVAKSAGPTKLFILSPADIPTKGLPRTLLTLHINGLRLCLFKREILSLRNLQTLNLSDNNLEKLPPELGKMPCLSELILNSNKLGNSTTADWKWIEGAQIIRTLKTLDISSNALQKLPNTLSKLQNLVSLKLDDNQLVSLPMGIGSIRSLRFLFVSNNKLKVLPASITNLRLQKIDVSFNCFKLDSKIGVFPKFKVNTLVEICSSMVIECKIAYARNLIPYTLVDYLNNSYYCICGKPNFNSLNYLRLDMPFSFFCESVVSNSYNISNNNASFECCVCSSKCLNYCVKKEILNEERLFHVADHQIVLRNPVDNLNYFF